MSFRRMFLTILSCIFCCAAIADDECAIGYTPSEFVTTTNLFNPAEITTGAVAGYTGIDYYGKIDSDYATLSIKVREGKTIPTGVSFGIVYKNLSDVVTANWMINSGNLKSTKGTIDIKGTESKYKDWGIAFSASEEKIPAALDALEIQLEKGKTATPYIPYGYSYTVAIGECIPCSPNTYKDFVGNEPCTHCPDGLVAPSGSTSVNECGRILHIGDFITFMPVGRRTEHGLCTMLDGVKYCADVYERK